MNLSPITLVTFGIGAVLVYAAVKNRDPRTVVRSSLTGAASSKNTANDAPAPASTAPAASWYGTAPAVNPSV